MKRIKGFTLIELLIVVAIIAILAAIAVPNFLEAQVRSKVSRVRSDMRSVATGIESYYVDTNGYPPYTRDSSLSVNNLGLSPTEPCADICTFMVWDSNPLQFHTMTSPISYLTSYPQDPFADTRGATFGYYKDICGWILISFGPDTDEGATPPGDIDPTVETLYDCSTSQPTYELIAGTGSGEGNESYTYDGTNGTVSPGDIWRVKQ